MEFVLVGQPNCGKSTLFNRVAGYKSETANFPGVTVDFLKGSLLVNGTQVDLVDLPGTYAFSASDEATQSAVDYLLGMDPGTVIINVVDASVLSRSLELTLQLLEMKRPMVLALNMIDEAERKGIQIDDERLERRLGIPVVRTVGKKGRGVSKLFRIAANMAGETPNPAAVDMPRNLEKCILRVVHHIENSGVDFSWDHRFLAIKLLEGEPTVTQRFLSGLDPDSRRDYRALETEVREEVGQDLETLITSFRHNMAFRLFEMSARVGDPVKKDFRESLDNWLMHPVLGYVFLVVILYASFSAVFSLGDAIEPLVSAPFASLEGWIEVWFGSGSVLAHLLSGVMKGVGGGIAIVIPYLLPFFIVFSIFEDTGYLSRIAYLIDNLMHRIGLHGLSVVPIVLGYGCTVPGILATRILKSRRDKLITATLTSMIPCSARMIVILGVAGALSLGAAGLVYLINIVVVALIGKMMSMAYPEVTPGMLLEIPKYHLPTFGVVGRKTGNRLREFLVIAWPLLIAGSVVFELITYFGLNEPINRFLSPFVSGLLGLPAAIGVVFLFGILRKELALLMLLTALGTAEVQTVLNPSQIMVFTVFSTFYIPCLATIAALARELSWKAAGGIAGITLMSAVLLSLLVRGFYVIFP